MTTVLIVDDHEMVREGLKVLLDRETQFQVIGGASNGREAIALARQLRPDIVIMDLALPELSGLDATEKIRAELPDTQVIALSSAFTSEQVFLALRAGALGYVLKQSAPVELIAAALKAAAGRRYLSARILESLDMASIDGHRLSPLERLSSREREVMQLAVMGRTSVEIARKLFLSPKTVDTYRSRIMGKLGVADHTGLVRFAIEHALIPR